MSQARPSHISFTNGAVTQQKVSILCPVCQSATSTVVWTPWVDVTDPAKLYGAASGIQGTQMLVRCSGCGLIYENPRYSDEVILEGYMTSEESGHDSQYPMRVNSFYRALGRLRRHLPPPGARVLDIGTAGGAFLDAAERFGYEANGMEPSQYLVNQGQQRGLRIQQGTIAKHSFPAHSFDMITLWDVIEHLTDPSAALREIRRLLKPDGVLLANFPDIGTLQAKLAGRRFWWVLSVHLQHFTRQTVSEICRRTGFETFHFQRYWQTLEFGYLEQMAAHFKIPLARQIHQLTPKTIRGIAVPYYASQTTALAKVKA